MHFRPSRDVPPEVRKFLDEVTALQLNPVSERDLEKGRRIGAGTFSVVFEAALKTREPETQTGVVAFKELRSDRQSFDVQCAQLLDEASVVARLRHPNILRYVGCGATLQKERPTPFMVQEYLSGGSLDEYISRLRRRRIAYDPRYSYTLGTALRWAKQVSSAVEYLHSSKIGILHRDIKLANLLLTDRQVDRADVKLADFGLSVNLHSLESVDKQKCVKISSWKYQTLSTGSRKKLAHWKMHPAQTVHTSLKNYSLWKRKSDAKAAIAPVLDNEFLYYDLTEETGSYMYMSPEVWLGLPYNEKVDIYSLGVLIAELLTGRPLSSCLLPEKSYEEAKNFSYCVANGLQLKCPRQFPKPIATILESCWGPDPVKRPTAKQICEVVSNYADSLKDADKMPLFHPMVLTSRQKLRLNLARMKYVHSN